MKISLLIVALSLAFFPGRASAVHDEVGQTRCLDCHVTLPLLKERPLSFHDDLIAVCGKCHTAFSCYREGDGAELMHPLGVVPTLEIPADMPLDRKGQLTCITCHLYHAEDGQGGSPDFLLRRPAGRTFCYYCHRDLGKGVKR